MLPISTAKETLISIAMGYEKSVTRTMIMIHLAMAVKIKMVTVSMSMAMEKQVILRLTRD